MLLNGKKIGIIHHTHNNFDESRNHADLIKQARPKNIHIVSFCLYKILENVNQSLDKKQFMFA